MAGTSDHRRRPLCSRHNCVLVYKKQYWDRGSAMKFQALGCDAKAGTGLRSSSLSRRAIVQLAAAGAVAGPVVGSWPARPAQAQVRTGSEAEDHSMPTSASSFVYVGARTTRERNARGDVLNVYAMNNATGEWRHRQLLGELVNPSFLAFEIGRASC